MEESHGGNIYRAAGHLGLKEHEIIDFSASINPLGVPNSVLAGIRDTMKYLHNYPIRMPDYSPFPLQRILRSIRN